MLCYSLHPSPRLPRPLCTVPALHARLSPTVPAPLPQEVGKGAASRAANAPSKAAAIAAGEEGAEAVEAVFTAGAK